MSAPISYYGGKSLMLPELLALIPPHKTYCEAFVGGGALFWEKQPAQANVINDKNLNMVKFYRACCNAPVELERKIINSVYSRELHKQSRAILKNDNPDKDDVDTAWAVWYSLNTSYGSKLKGAFQSFGSYDTLSKSILSFVMKRRMFVHLIKKRFDNVIIECDDAVKIIKRIDTPDTFFYCDPPYYNSDCGHYKGYSLDDFKNLLETLSRIKGKFLLSSYPSDILTEYVNKNKWNYKEIIRNKSMANKFMEEGEISVKTECLTFNYEDIQQKLF